MENVYDFSDPLDIEGSENSENENRESIEQFTDECFNTELLCAQYGLDEEETSQVFTFDQMPIARKLSIIFINQMLLKNMLEKNNKMTLLERAEKIINSDNIRLYLNSFLNLCLLDPMNNNIDYDCIEQFSIFKQNLIKKKLISEEELAFGNSSIRKLFFETASKVKTELRRRIIGKSPRLTCLAPLEVYSKSLYSPVGDRFASAGKLVEAKSAILRNIRFGMSSVDGLQSLQVNTDEDEFPRGKQFWSIISNEFRKYDKYKNLHKNKSLIKQFLLEVKPIIDNDKKKFTKPLTFSPLRKRSFSSIQEDPNEDSADGMTESNSQIN